MEPDPGRVHFKILGEFHQAAFARRLQV